ncbi:MAG: glycerophosphodiester phosphodiesterase [Desulfurococcaceae archaeon]
MDIIKELRKRPFSIVGHRGAAGVKPENTVSSILYAYNNGADVVEVDVRSTSDGFLILLHDEDFSRVSGVSIKPRDVSYRWIKENLKVMGEEVAELSEVIDLVKKLNKYLLIEVKEPDTTSKVVELVLMKGALSEVAIISFFDEALKIVKEMEPRIATGLIYSKPPGRIIDAKSLGAEIVLPKYGLATEKAIKLAHRLDLTVVAWTVNELNTAAELIKRGVDAIASDYPDKLASYRSSVVSHLNKLK